MRPDLPFFLLLLFFSQTACNYVKMQPSDRVQSALEEKGEILDKNLSQYNLSKTDLHLLIIAYKSEDILEIYGKKIADSAYQKIATYPICTKSGVLGAKRAEGDKQVPEGFYHIDRFNPQSSFWLSLGLNYPNLSDQRKSSAERLGGDIFIHGACVSVGCLPITDDKIKETYLYALYAKNNGQTEIPVYIFPFQMNPENFQKYTQSTNQKPENVELWTQLQTGYDKFMRSKQQLAVSVNQAGDYVFE